MPDSSAIEQLQDRYKDRMAGALGQPHARSRGHFEHCALRASPGGRVFPRSAQSARRPNPPRGCLHGRCLRCVLSRIFERFLSGEWAFIDTLVIPRTSEQEHKLFLYLREVARQEPERKLPRVLLYNLPHARSAEARIYGLERTRELIEALPPASSGSLEEPSPKATQRAVRCARYWTCVRAGSPAPRPYRSSEPSISWIAPNTRPWPMLPRGSWPRSQRFTVLACSSRAPCFHHPHLHRMIEVAWRNRGLRRRLVGLARRRGRHPRGHRSSRGYLRAVRTSDAPSPRVFPRDGGRGLVSSGALRRRRRRLLSSRPKTMSSDGTTRGCAISLTARTSAFARPRRRLGGRSFRGTARKDRRVRPWDQEVTVMAERQLRCTTAAAEHQKAWFAELRRDVFEHRKPYAIVQADMPLELFAGDARARGQQSVVGSHRGRKTPGPLLS